MHEGSLLDAAEIGNRREGVLDESVYPIKMLMKAVKGCSVSAYITHWPSRFSFANHTSYDRSFQTIYNINNILRYIKF